jgi:hypothetical protein
MAHQLKIVLKYTKPQVWRTVVVPEEFTFHQLHTVIQSVMNWEDSHLYQFNLGAPYRSDSIQLIEIEDDFDGFSGGKYQKMDALETKLTDIFQGDFKKISYTYDFGDDWLHEIRLLKKPKEEVKFPQCIAGEGAAPIEDCGSYPGFYELIHVSNKKRKSQEDKEMLEWYGIPFDTPYEELFAFDIDKANHRLFNYFIDPS